MKHEPNDDVPGEIRQGMELQRKQPTPSDMEKQCLRNVGGDDDDNLNDDNAFVLQPTLTEQWTNEQVNTETNGKHMSITLSLNK